MQSRTSPDHLSCRPCCRHESACCRHLHHPVAEITRLHPLLTPCIPAALRSIQLLTALAGALSVTLPAAAAPLQQIMSAVLVGEPQPFGGSGPFGERRAAAADIGGSKGASDGASEFDAGEAGSSCDNLSAGSCSSSDCCSWSDGGSDSDSGSVNGSDSDSVSPYGADIGIDGAIARPILSSSDKEGDSDSDSDSPVSASEQPAALETEYPPKLRIRTKASLPGSLPARESDANEPASLQPRTPAAMVDFPKYSSDASLGTGNDCRSEHSSPAKPAHTIQACNVQPGAAAPGEEAFAKWHAVHSYQVRLQTILHLSPRPRGVMRSLRAA